jgi:ferric-dicitrate binding protein FerR (iron transport regulator)
MNIPSKFLQAINNYFTGKATSEEKRQVNEWYYSFNDEDTVEVPAKAKDLKREINQRLRNRISKSIGRPGVAEMNPRPIYLEKIAAAAAILLFLSGGIYFYNQNQQVKKSSSSLKLVSRDLPPGGNKAVLTLADGSQISLNDAANGEIAKQAGITITKTSDGLVVYLVTDSRLQTSSSKPIYNTIETPKGGQYQVNLPDGTNVWLNAGSSLRYPVAFAGNERKVELTGEAYFEVAHNRAMPFKVVSDNQTVEVLGTHFNINAYKDEPSTNTTLLEGSVMVFQLTTSNSQLLKPGQESIIRDRAGLIEVQNADTESVIAWKNGFFQFNNIDIQTIMRQLERWYDVKVSYQEKLPGKYFTGVIARNTNISKVLHMLELTNSVHFEINGKEVIVLK